MILKSKLKTQFSEGALRALRFALLFKRAFIVFLYNIFRVPKVWAKELNPRTNHTRNEQHLNKYCLRVKAQIFSALINQATNCNQSELKVARKSRLLEKGAFRGLRLAKLLVCFKPRIANLELLQSELRATNEEEPEKPHATWAQTKHEIRYNKHQANNSRKEEQKTHLKNQFNSNQLLFIYIFFFILLCSFVCWFYHWRVCLSNCTRLFWTKRVAQATLVCDFRVYLCLSLRCYYWIELPKSGGGQFLAVRSFRFDAKQCK